MKDLTQNSLLAIADHPGIIHGTCDVKRWKLTPGQSMHLLSVPNIKIPELLPET